MPYFTRIGRIDGNKTGVGSRGYHLYRRGNRVLRRWGRIDVTHRKHPFMWAGRNLPQQLVERDKNSVLAAKRVKALARWLQGTRMGYESLPSGQKIQPYRRQ